MCEQDVTEIAINSNFHFSSLELSKSFSMMYFRFTRPPVARSAPKTREVTAVFVSGGCGLLDRLVGFKTAVYPGFLLILKENALAPRLFGVQRATGAWIIYK